MNVNATVRLASSSGLCVEVDTNGSLRRIDLHDVMVNSYLANQLEGGPANLFLRRIGERIEWIPLLGPNSPGEVSLDAQGFEVRGEWLSLHFRVSLRLAAAAAACFWHVELRNGGGAPATVDLICAQDVALADYGTVRLNEYYVSQYVDHTPLEHPERGAVLALRQNLPIGGRHPWAAIASLGRAVSFATDALQFHGLASRAGKAPPGLTAARLPGVRLQHEHALAVLQQAPLPLAAGASVDLGFCMCFELDHPEPSSVADLSAIDRACALPEASPAPPRGGATHLPARSLFSAPALLAALDLDDADVAAIFGNHRRCVERAGDGLWSFYTGLDTHVVLAAKERSSLRPHGQILRSGDQPTPDEASFTSTVWMNGVFHSMVTQGHVSINRFFSTTHGYLGLFRSHGQRVFVEIDGGWRLLDVASAFAMSPNEARWLYKHAGGLLEVRSWAPTERHELWLAARVLAGPPCRFLVSSHVAVNGDDGSAAIPVDYRRDERGVAIAFLADSELGGRFPRGRFRIDPAPGTAVERVGGDELLFADSLSRREPFVVLVTAPSASFGLRISGQLLDDGCAPAAPAAPRPDADAPAAQRFWKGMTGPLTLRSPAESAARADVADLAEILPWLAHDAWIHYLAPRGLEQYSGGGWGTRDVCQGPVELLLALGRPAPVRDLLLRVFANQNADGDWPQWFMFFARERSIRGGDSHGDIVFWPLLALARYLLACDDAALLDAPVPFFENDGSATVLDHVQRALDLIARRVIPGTRLAVYGNGDWNDALQPVDRALAQRLCSAWTVTLHHQTLTALAAALRRAGRDALAASLEVDLPAIHDDFQRLLVADGVVAGLTHFRVDGEIDHFLHPRDGSTGVRFSLLPMIHAILADLFTPAQVERHVALIRDHLLGADGARLFDRPLPYRGGRQVHFQRAETSTFFGREIGLMYTHAHLRYAEAMAHLGDADAFFLALRQANPVGLARAVPQARARQANCYTSSSDAAFADRYQAAERYAEVRDGTVALEGGWRVYSSGAGIALRLVRECLLGLRLGNAEIGIDPVLPRTLDGLRADVIVAERPLEVIYQVGARGCGPRALLLNGTALPFARAANPYREGGAIVAVEQLRARLRETGNTLRIELG